ncbi:hypothetical protein C8F04DRAFT_1270131 [Mycena alexandri]|uniref:Uncharacterized protein n=1 Tax=Mycena alexandri TaxID=1745969 RepID=A0AAD6WV29_9AGAR|nr:hypothetical protein C8F04DRAFT_1270131 [Mycena alexandri]
MSKPVHLDRGARMLEPSILAYLVHKGQFTSTLPRPQHQEICTKKPSSRKDRRKMLGDSGTKGGAHSVVAGLQKKLRAEMKQRQAHRKAVVRRLKVLRDEGDRGSMDERGGNDSGRDTDDLEEEVERREILGDDWRILSSYSLLRFVKIKIPHGPTKATAKKTPDGAQGARQKRNRRKKGDAGLKPGKQSWIFGTKLVFFAARAQEWKDANANGNLGLGEFYTKMTNLYALKYGYEMADHEDLAEDKPDPTDPDAEILGSADLTEEEAAERSATHLQIRKRIAAWYCRTYRGLEAREKNIFAEIMAGIKSTGPSYPKRAQPIHFYSRKYYEEKVKARFEARWATEVQRAEDLEMPEPEAIKIRNAVTKEVFEEETPEFQAELKLAVEAEHVAAVRAWELTSSQADEHNAAYYLEPLANAIRDKFLLNCTILVCGPMGDRGGAIEVRSVHAGTTRGLAPRKWYQSDPAGYDATERCFVKFTEKCFSDEDCLARTVGVEQVGATTSGVSATGVRAPGESPGAGSSGSRGRPGAAGSTNSPDAGRAGADAGAQGGDAQGGGDEGGDAQGGTAGGTAGRAQGGDPGGDQGGDAQGGAAGGTSGGTAPGAQGGDQGGDQGDDDDDIGEGASVHRAWRQRGEEWTPEMKKAYKAFYTARDEFGGVWGDCVDACLELENASGCNNEGGQLTTRERPAAVTEFISGGRKWERVREIAYVGTKAEEGTYVAKWWAWWAQIAGGGDLAKMHGRTGFMLVLGSLLWWGVKQRGAEWEEAAKTVTAQLKETVESGEIVKKTRVAPKGKQPKRKHAERDESDDEEEEEKEEEAPSRYVTRKRRKAEESEKRQTRGQAAAAPKTVAAKKAAGRRRSPYKASLMR